MTGYKINHFFAFFKVTILLSHIILYDANADFVGFNLSKKNWHFYRQKKPVGYPGVFFSNSAPPRLSSLSLSLSLSPVRCFAPSFLPFNRFCIFFFLLPRYFMTYLFALLYLLRNQICSGGWGSLGRSSPEYRGTPPAPGCLRPARARYSAGYPSRSRPPAHTWARIIGLVCTRVNQDNGHIVQEISILQRTYMLVNKQWSLAN